MDDHPVGPPFGIFVSMLSGYLFLMLVVPMLLLDWVMSLNVVEVGLWIAGIIP